MYSYEQRIKAVQLLIKYDMKCYTNVVTVVANKI